MTLDPRTADVQWLREMLFQSADLLKAISDALEGMADWRCSAVRSAVGRVLTGADDPGMAADWLREFMAQRETTRP